MSSTNNHVQQDSAPSWLTDSAATAWAAGPAPERPAPGPASDKGVGAVPPARQEPESSHRPAAADPQPAPPRPSAEPVAPGPRPAPTPAPAPTRSPALAPGPVASPAAESSGAPQEFRPDWDGEGNVFSNAVKVRKSPPKQGWRAAVYALSGGRWNPGLSEAEERLREQLGKIRTPLPGPHSVVVSSIKGGVGKTTVTALLGLALAEYRGDRVIAMDANPDAGTLGDRLVGEQQASKTTVRDLLDNLDQIRSSTQLSGYTHLAGRLQVLTSEQEPELSEMFSADDYEAVLRTLSRYYEALLTDSGTGVVHSAMQGSLRHADSLVIVGAPTQDGASRASRTLQWLGTHQDQQGRFPYRQLAQDAVVVLSCDRSSPYVDESVIREHFKARCRAVVELPADPHLSTGGIVDLDALSPAGRDAALHLAATVAEGFQGRQTTGLAAHGFRVETPR